MKNKEDRMIDFVARNYEENRFDPEKQLRSLSLSKRATLSKRTYLPQWLGRSLSLSKRRNIIIMLSGVAAAAIVGIFLYTGWRSSWTDYAAYDVAQTFTLPDSSSVTLAPGATLGLQRHRDKRLVRMTGKVYFNVRHDDSAPFRVDVGTGFVKVFGTRFVVDASARPAADSVIVSVVSGKVLFSPAGSPDGVVLTKGRSAVLGPSWPAPKEVTPKHPNPAAWATGEFVYENTPLADVLSELSDYYAVRFSLRSPTSPGSNPSMSAVDPAVSQDFVPDLRLTGEFSTTSLSEILSLIKSALGVDIQILQGD